MLPVDAGSQHPFYLLLQIDLGQTNLLSCLLEKSTLASWTNINHQHPVELGALFFS